jgi:GNAT superfamily N-acetyltransferase
LVADRLDAEPVAPPNPYWAKHGLTFQDPDGFRVVLVPARWPPAAGDVHIGWRTGPRSALRSLFEFAEDSHERLDASVGQGRVLAATDGELVVGYVQLVASEAAGDIELKSMAVAGPRQQQGIGSALVERHCRVPRGGRAHDDRRDGDGRHRQPALLPATQVPPVAHRTRRLDPRPTAARPEPRSTASRCAIESG